VQVQHALELPESPGPMRVRDDTLYIGSMRGVLIVDADLNMRLAPCEAERTYDGALSSEQVQEVVRRYRPIVDRCLEPLPSSELPCGESSTPTVGLWFRIDQNGAVAEVEPMEEPWSARFPEVEACLMEHAKAWQFPAPEGGWALLGYAFSKRGSE
jgi:hypothetical protein